MNKQKSALLALGLATFAWAATGSDWQSSVAHTWAFKAQQGEVKISLIVAPPTTQAPSLELDYTEGAHPSVAEEVGFLSQVLRELPAHGVDPRHLCCLSVSGWAEPEVKEQMAKAALHSETWRSRNTVVGGGERVAEDLLRSLGSYDGFNAAFAPYGLTLKLAGLEKVLSVRCMELKLSDATCNRHHNVTVPVAAHVYFNVQTTAPSN